MKWEELAGQKDDADDPEAKEATEALPATRLETDKHRSRLRGIRGRQLAERHIKTIQYGVVWGKHPNRPDSWVHKDYMRMSIPGRLASYSFKAWSHR